MTLGVALEGLRGESNWGISGAPVERPGGGSAPCLAEGQQEVGVAGGEGDSGRGGVPARV